MQTTFQLISTRFHLLTACLLAFVGLTFSLQSAQAQETKTPASEDTPAAIVRELAPGETPPPFVQLSPTEAPIIWDVSQVGEFRLVDQFGEEVTRESLLGKPWVANFIFARCISHCPLMSRRIMELNEELADVDVRFVTITVDPEYDTPEIMKEFSDTWKAQKDRWLFCTGEVDQVWKLIREGFKVAAWEHAGTKKLPGMEFAHTDQLIHVDKDGVIQGRYTSSIAYEVQDLKRVLQGKVETPVKYRPASKALLDNIKQTVEKDTIADKLSRLPVWATWLPPINASLNFFATVLLMTGFLAVKSGQFKVHKQLMLMAFGVSVVFLACYLTSHWALHHYTGLQGRPFNGTGTIKVVYFSILITHVILAAIVPVLAIITIRNGLKAYPHGTTPEQFSALAEQRKRHHAWAKWTFPIWMYVSVTGVIIYFMLYHI